MKGMRVILIPIIGLSPPPPPLAPRWIHSAQCVMHFISTLHSCPELEALHLTHMTHTWPTWFKRIDRKSGFEFHTSVWLEETAESLAKWRFHFLGLFNLKEQSSRLHWVIFVLGFRSLLKELSHGILSYFGHIQNYLQMVGNLKITVS